MGYSSHSCTLLKEKRRGEERRGESRVE